ncbi:LamG-like jellyroll fold domain-containing protein [Prosthecobacter sp.]|uniref:LamG-like jellyroll fold domain-containing protein n=1 Tax=Prosthecobacter sp. TaxID=1965333 RepID=UPI003784511C
MKNFSRIIQSLACLWLAFGFSSPLMGGVVINSYVFSTGGGAPTDPYFANVILLLHCNGTNGSTTYVDSSSYNRTVTAYNGAALSTTSPKFGTASSMHDGVDDYVEVASSSAFSFGTSTDFTIEFWLWADSTDSDSCGIGQFSGSYVVLLSGVLYVGNGAVNMCSYSYAGYYDQWTHVAVSRTGSNMWLYLNGTMVAAGVNAAWGNSSTIILMRSPVVGGYGKGKIDDLRITSGIGRGTAGGITLPSAQYPDS